MGATNLAIDHARLAEARMHPDYQRARENLMEIDRCFQEMRNLERRLQELVSEPLDDFAKAAVMYDRLLMQA